MRIAVNEHIQIPHTLIYKGKELSFEPICENVPDEFGELLKNQKANYRELGANETVDVSKYKYKDTYFVNTFQKEFEQLSSAGKAEIINIVRQKKILESLPQGEPIPLEEMTIPKMREYANSKNIEIPDTIVKKADILAFIKDAEKPKE